MLKFWDTIIAFAATIGAILVAAELVFPNSNPLTWWVDTLLTFLFAADLLLHLSIAQWKISRYTRDEITKTERGSYIWFALDLLAMLPFGFIFRIEWLLLPRLLKLARVGHFMAELRHRFLAWSNALKLVFFAYWLAISTHFLACIWIALGGITPKETQVSTYISGLYWCVTTLASVGYGDITPQNDTQRIFAMFVMFFGVGVYGYVIGNVTQLMANMDPAKVNYLENMEKLSAFIRYRNIPPHLQKRIRDYYGYLWEKRLGYDEMTIISALPPGLRTDLALFLIRDILVKVPLFQGADESFIRDIATHLRPVVFTPGDYVFKAGDIGHDMFFISRGSLDILSADEKITYTTLSEGAFFGEIALIMSTPRTATVRAAEYCDLYALRKETLDRVLKDHPDIAEHISEIGRQRQEQNRKLEKVE